MTTEAHPAVRPLRMGVQARTRGPFPVGMVSLFADAPDADVLPCEGQYVPVSAYPELYAAIGDHYCPPRLAHEVPTLPQRILRRLGFRVKVRTVVSINPAYTPGLFRLPDYRNHSKGDA